MVFVLLVFSVCYGLHRLTRFNSFPAKQYFVFMIPTEPPTDAQPCSRVATTVARGRGLAINTRGH